MAEIGTDIEKAASLLTQGELVAIPTETVYGLAGNALNVEAVAKIFAAKNRPQFDPLIVHIPALSLARNYVTHIPKKAERLAQLFWPGPLTLVLEKKDDTIPALVTSGLNTVGFRSPDHHLTRKLLTSLSFPLAAPSANPFGYVSPTSPQHVNEQLGNNISYILDGGICSIGIESTIVGFEGDDPVVLRLGGLSLERIEAVTGKLKVNTHSTSNPLAPGQLKSHYAPGKPLIIGKIEELLQHYPAHTAGILSFARDFNSPYQRILSPGKDPEEAARNLFQYLRDFDKMPVDIILAELLPEVGLGRAINDRLKRAAAVDN
ncbi:MAG: threonylcarbamoyl-AMP synthase [Cyclobacteriaceae bacterium]|nr:threonylcarbamoyl-AMP synthase [Cyclobacteriaceae bacterium]UYN85964.1 MAG: threonylcarbamoyl-AMP synthase [Cyclobacteriaceae bacterium]